MMRYVLLAGALSLLAVPTWGQDPPTAEPLALGTMAPDFALVGATRYGILQDTIRLTQFRGKTVVLAFFFRARTSG